MVVNIRYFVGAVELKVGMFVYIHVNSTHAHLPYATGATSHQPPANLLPTFNYMLVFQLFCRYRNTYISFFPFFLSLPSLVSYASSTLNTQQEFTSISFLHCHITCPAAFQVFKLLKYLP